MRTRERDANFETDDFVCFYAIDSRPRNDAVTCACRARVAGVEIPNNKRTETALTYVYGIGNTSAKAIMAATGLENKRVRELSEEELTTLREEVEKYQIEGELRRFTTMNIKRLKEIQCHRGKMHIRNLPVRGQRTKTNARTRKGKVKTVAGKNK